MIYCFYSNSSALRNWGEWSKVICVTHIKIWSETDGCSYTFTHVYVRVKKPIYIDVIDSIWTCSSIGTLNILCGQSLSQCFSLKMAILQMTPKRSVSETLRDGLCQTPLSFSSALRSRLSSLLLLLRLPGAKKRAKGSGRAKNP